MSPRPPRLSRASMALALVLAASAAACDRNREDLGELRDQQRLILAKLDDLERKLDRVAARPSAPPRATGPNPGRTYNLPVGQSPIKGPENAPITIVEFSDYQCPFCARSEPIISQALQAYPTRARVVFKHFPLTSIHPQAMGAALAASAAQRQGKFWEMHELLFANQKALDADQIRGYARQLGLDMARFDADMASAEVKAQVQEDIDLAQRAGVRGTPTIFVNGKLLQNRTLAGFKQAIEPLLAAPAAAPLTGATDDQVR